MFTHQFFEFSHVTLEAGILAGEQDGALAIIFRRACGTREMGQAETCCRAEFCLELFVGENDQ